MKKTPHFLTYYLKGLKRLIQGHTAAVRSALSFLATLIVAAGLWQQDSDRSDHRSGWSSSISSDVGVSR